MVVFAEISLINHSCRANTHFVWHSATKEGRVYASTDIAKEEELTVPYGGADGSFAQRQATLKTRYNFDCACEMCALPLDDRKKSDKRRAEIHRIERDLDRMARGRRGYQPVPTLLPYQRWIHLMREEGLHRQVVADMWVQASQTATAFGDRARTEWCLEQALETNVLFRGEDSVSAIACRKTLQTLLELRGPFRTLVWSSDLEDIPQSVSERECEEWLCNTPMVMWCQEPLGLTKERQR